MKQQINVLNAFSLNMVDFDGSISWRKIPVSIIKDMIHGDSSIAPYLKSYIGHADTAAVISADLGFVLCTNRETVKLEAGSRCLVCQYKGPRLPEGATHLPEGATIEYYWLTVSL
jgi:hypothetical protein